MKIVKLDFFPKDIGKNINGNLWTRKELNKLYAAVKKAAKTGKFPLFASFGEHDCCFSPELSAAIGVVKDFDAKSRKLTVHLFPRRLNNLVRKAHERPQRLATWGAVIGDTVNDNQKIIFQSLENFFVCEKKDVDPGAKR